MSLVVIYPDVLKFSSNVQTEKICIVNSLDLPISYSLKCTNPVAFDIKQDQGEILASRTLDIVIHLVDRSITQAKFRVRVYANNQTRKLTEKVITVTNRSGVYDNGNHPAERIDHEHFLQLRQTKTNENDVNVQSNANFGNMNQFPYFAYFIYFMFGVCVLILYLPHEEMKESLLSFFRVTVTCKIVAGFVLGVITTFFLIKNRQ